jgi:glycosyltransferase involved in cell wall biosynthesis
MARPRILQVFSRYLHYGGEELSVLRINHQLEADHDVIRFDLDNHEWVGPNAPPLFLQARRTLYNPQTRDRFEKAVAEHRPDVALFHNIYPVGSPSLYHAACRMNLPVLQYAHNYRPFSVSGSLFVKGRIRTEPLHGHYWREIMCGTWQNSVIKTAVLALAFKRLIRSGWLDSVKAWICVSEFMCDKFVEAGVSPERVFALRHSWDKMENPPVAEDGGYYLFLGRLVDVKGVGVLLQAWQKLHDTLGKKAPDLWVAGEGPMEGAVKAAAARNPRVKAVGMLKGDAKRDALRRCRAMVIPSIWWEPLGLVTCESYDYGKPVLAAASGGLTETIEDGVTGLLHEPGNADKIVSDVIVMEALPPEKRVAMGQAGRQWLVDHAGSDLWKQKFATILEKTLKNASGSRVVSG